MGYNVTEYQQILNSFHIKATKHFDAIRAKEVTSLVHSIALGFYPRINPLRGIHIAEYTINKSMTIYAQHALEQEVKEKELSAFYTTLEFFLESKSTTIELKKLIVNDLATHNLVIESCSTSESNSGEIITKDLILPSIEKITSLNIEKNVSKVSEKQSKLKRVLNFRFNSPALVEYLNRKFEFEYEFIGQKVLVIEESSTSSNLDVFTSYLNAWNTHYQRSSDENFPALTQKILDDVETDCPDKKNIKETIKNIFKD